MRRTSLLPVTAALLVILGACDATTPADTVPVSPSSPTTSTAPSTIPLPTASAPTSPTVTSSPVPELPPGIPPMFEGDVAAANVPTAALVPLKTEVTDAWYGVTTTGEAIVVAWQVPGPDPLRLDRGYAVWRRFDDGGAPWRPVLAGLVPRSAGALGIAGTPAELTGDGSDDVLLEIQTGGSGSCGRVLVLDLAAGAAVYDEEGCDRRVEPHSGPTGLLVTAAVYEPGDPHCCPSAFRETVLTYRAASEAAGSWAIASDRTVPA